MIKLKNSNCVHFSESCVYLKNKDFFVLNERNWKNTFKKCKTCWKSACMICFDSCKIDCPCGDHEICENCLLNYIKTEVINPKFKKHRITCPCKNQSAFFTFEKFPKKIKDVIKQSSSKYDDLNTDSTQRHISHKEYILEEIMTLNCPECNSAFVDFEACVALQCRCGQHFCGFCLQTFDTNNECHNHVLSCKYNPSDNYYVSFDVWKKVQHNKKCFQIWKYILSLYWEERSILYVMYMLSIINRHDHACIPYLITRSQDNLFSLNTLSYIITMPIILYSNTVRIITNVVIEHGAKFMYHFAHKHIYIFTIIASTLFMTMTKLFIHMYD